VKDLTLLISRNIDPVKLEEFLIYDSQSKGQVKVIIPVHLFGQMCEMDQIMEIARKYGLFVVEDAAQAIGAEYKGRKAGSIGDVGCLSFFPSKNLGGFGDGGMVTTNDQNLYEKIKILRVHGGSPKYHHKVIGGNFRLDEIQAAILQVKLKHLKEWTQKRRNHAAFYLENIKDFVGSVNPPVTKDENSHIFNQFVIRAKNRDKLRKYLADNGISTEIYYPIPFHLQECFSYLGHKEGDFPEAERAAKETLALPVYPELTIGQKMYIIEKIRNFFSWTDERFRGQNCRD